MPKARSILKRVRAVKSTRTITRTMEMISTARFKKTHDRVVAARPYTDGLTHVVGELVEALRGRDLQHPLMAVDASIKDQAMLVLTANRGLCGSYNSNNLRLAMSELAKLNQDGQNVKLHVAGKRGMTFFRFRHIEVAGGYSHFDFQPKYDEVASLAEEFMAKFLDRKIGSLRVVYTQFVSAGVQRPTVMQLLPLTVEKGKEVQASVARPIYDFVPSPTQVLERLLPMTVKLGLYQAFLDAAVSEQIARMTSMRAATDNADEMIHHLTIRYNRTRQSQITTELAEIMGGRASLEQ